MKLIKSKGFQVIIFFTCFMIIFLSFRIQSNAMVTNNFLDLSQSEIVKVMGAGWNLGNQLEASDSFGNQGETLWGNPAITQASLDAIKNAGFDTIRIPITWLNKIGSAPNYTIDSQWLDRVQEVVDYALESDLYVIIDLHNDGSITIDNSWVLTEAENQEEIKNKLSKVWSQIAVRFADYDEHLIFETMNEVGAESGTSTENIIAAIEKINAYNQVIVDTVRQTGGNNDRRWLLIPGWSTNIDYTAGDFGFQVPEDRYLSSSIPSGEKRIMISVHYYTPWEFAGQEDGNTTTWGNAESNTITWANEEYMKSQLKDMYDEFVLKGYPVVIGEYGCVSKEFLNSSNHNSRIYYISRLCQYALEYGIVPVYWDNGNTGDYGLAIFNRWNSYEIKQPGILSAIMYYFGEETSAQIDINKDSLEMKLGDASVFLSSVVISANSEEWVEWKSSDPTIVTVDRFGNIKPVGIGVAVVTAMTNGDSDSCTITVTEPEECRIKLYMQNSSNWQTKESSVFASIHGDDTYSLSISGTAAEMSNITLLYLQDLSKYLGANTSTKFMKGNVTINSVSFNGQACTLTQSSYPYDSANGGFYIGLINTWGINNISNIQAGSGDGKSLTNVIYQDMNTLQVEFTIENSVLAGNTTEVNLYPVGTETSYSTNDASWLLTLEDNDLITIKYACTNPSQAYWSILGWGAVVNGVWVNGPSYNADGQNPTVEKTVTITAGDLKTSLGISETSQIDYLSLTPFNSGYLSSLSFLRNN